MVCFDASVLVNLFDPRLAGDRKSRIDLLVKTLTEQKASVVIPAPAYTEFMVGAGKARQNYQTRLEQLSGFRVEPFGQKAALECAIILAEVFTAKEKRAVSRTKMKFDWMIVAIAKVAKASVIYTGDDDIARYAQHARIATISLDSLPMPPQPDLPLFPDHGSRGA